MKLILKVFLNFIEIYAPICGLPDVRLPRRVRRIRATHLQPHRAPPNCLTRPAFQAPIYPDLRMRLFHLFHLAKDVRRGRPARAPRWLCSSEIIAMIRLHRLTAAQKR